ncbi:MAG: hypothetical protein Q9226_005532 [Calogaya cf. arnoldii]
MTHFVQVMDFSQEMQDAAKDLKERLEYATHEELITMICKLYRVSLMTERDIKNSSTALEEITEANDRYQQKYFENAVKTTAKERTRDVTRAATRSAVKSVISVATKALFRVSNRMQTRSSTRAATNASIRATNKAATRATTRAITRAVARAANNEFSDATYETAFDYFLRKELLPKSRDLRYLAVTLSQGVGWSLGLYDPSE